MNLKQYTPLHLPLQYMCKHNIMYWFFYLQYNALFHWVFGGQTKITSTTEHHWQSREMGEVPIATVYNCKRQHHWAKERYCTVNSFDSQPKKISLDLFMKLLSETLDGVNTFFTKLHRLQCMYCMYILGTPLFLFLIYPRAYAFHTAIRRLLPFSLTSDRFSTKWKHSIPSTTNISFK